LRQPLLVASLEISHYVNFMHLFTADGLEENMAAKKEIGRERETTNGDKWSRALAGVDRLLISAVLLVLSAFLINLLVREAFANYAKCNYLIVDRLEEDPFFCDGFDVKFLGTTIFTIPGLKVAMDPSLERIRSAAAWGVVFVFAGISLILAIFINNWKTIVKLIRLDKEEWKKFMAGVRIWLFLFVGFCLVFYFTVVR